jgi:ribose/xylose/arabinose/galactoside ABC-type transport system permease subunit
MKSNIRRIILAVLFMFSVANFSRIQGNENIRTVQFLGIFAMGMLFSLLVREIVESIRNKQK